MTKRATVPRVVATVCETAPPCLCGGAPGHPEGPYGRRAVREDQSGRGFIAALDQSGGSTPKALAVRHRTGRVQLRRQEMYDRSTRCGRGSSPVRRSTATRILGAILFERHDGPRDRRRRHRASTCGTGKHVVPFLKVDKGLAAEADGVQLMKPIPDARRTPVERAQRQGRVRHQDALGDQDADEAGVRRSSTSSSNRAAGSSPPAWCRSSSPRSTSTAPDKAAAEELLKAALLDGARIDSRGPGGDAQADACRTTTTSTPSSSTTRRCSGSCALSGGYSREEANAELARNPGVVASFSRALTEGLSAHQSDGEFDAALDESIASIYAASVT